MSDPITAALAGAAADKAAEAMGGALDAVAMAVEAGLNREDVVAAVKEEIKAGRLAIAQVGEFVHNMRNQALARIGKSV